MDSDAHTYYNSKIERIEITLQSLTYMFFDYANFGFISISEHTMMDVDRYCPARRFSFLQILTGNTTRLRLEHVERQFPKHWRAL